MAATDYFPPTPPDDAAHDMADANVVPNGAAPPPNQPTKTKNMPNKMSLTLSHLPSKKDIKVTYPRSPSTVSTKLPLGLSLKYMREKERIYASILSSHV